MISFFHPEKIFKHSSRQAMPTLVNLLTRLPRIYKGDPQILDDEWRYLDSITGMQEEFRDLNNKVVPFYQRLADYRQFGKHVFKNLSTFVLQILSLPVSNADAERLFSKLNLIKTDNRNRLEIESLKSLLYISDAVKEQESCFTFVPSDAMLNCITH